VHVLFLYKSCSISLSTVLFEVVVPPLYWGSLAQMKNLQVHAIINGISLAVQRGDAFLFCHKCQRILMPLQMEFHWLIWEGGDIFSFSNFCHNGSLPFQYYSLKGFHNVSLPFQYYSFFVMYVALIRYATFSKVEHSGRLQFLNHYLCSLKS
jgi:hypothetical protein